MSERGLIIAASYFVVSLLFIFGLKRMSSPATARGGIRWAGVGMVLATVVTLLWPGMQNYTLIISAIVIGAGLAWWAGLMVKMTDMPQMVAIYNGMGGGAAAAIAAVEFARGHITEPGVMALAALGAMIGCISFSGSLVAFAKLQGLMSKTWRLPAQNWSNLILFVATFGLGVYVVVQGQPSGYVVAFFLCSLALGLILTLPIGGADMPVVISLYNALTGLAVGFEGFVLQNPALIIAGVVVGAAGTLLTKLMAKAMNRPLTNILFTPITGEAQIGNGVTGSLKEVSALDAASILRYAQKVIVVPGYGMAVAGAQHKVWEMSKILLDAGVSVHFAIHPVAGRMPGHMNVLLAEAGVPYELISDMEEINGEFATCDVALIIGANDVVNPAARHDKSSPIYGMPILNADQAQNVIVIKRGKGTGYSGIENELFYKENTRMLYGSAQQATAQIIAGIKEIQG